MTLPTGRERTALEELIRWRIFARKTGAGLMAELGSHQLDAASIFCRHSVRTAAKLIRSQFMRSVVVTFSQTIAMQRTMYIASLNSLDRVYDGRFDVAMKTLKGENKIDPYTVDPNKKIVVTYSSINGNGFGGYGEVVMGTKGTMILEKELEIMLYAGSE